jgi:hypothetical protein
MTEGRLRIARAPCRDADATPSAILQTINAPDEFAACPLYLR